MHAVLVVIAIRERERGREGGSLRERERERELNFVSHCAGCLLLSRSPALRPAGEGGESVPSEEREDALAAVQAIPSGILSDHQRPLCDWSTDALSNHARPTLSHAELKRTFDLQSEPENNISNQVSVVWVIAKCWFYENY